MSIEGAVEIAAPPGGWGALAILAGSLASAGIGQLGIWMAARRRQRGGADRIKAVSVEHAYSELARSQEARISELREDLNTINRELRETRTSLEEKNSEWMIASRLHEECERRLSRVEGRLRKLDGKEA